MTNPCKQMCRKREFRQGDRETHLAATCGHVFAPTQNNMLNIWGGTFPAYYMSGTIAAVSTLWPGKDLAWCPETVLLLSPNGFKVCSDVPDTYDDMMLHEKPRSAQQLCDSVSSLSREFGVEV